MPRVFQEESIKRTDRATRRFTIIAIILAALVIPTVILTNGSRKPKYYDIKIIELAPDASVNVGDISFSIVDANDFHRIKIGITKPTNIKIWW